MLNSSLLFVPSLSNQLLPNSKTRESNNPEPYSSDTTAKELFQCSYYFSLPSEVKLASELSLQHFFFSQRQRKTETAKKQSISCLSRTEHSPLSLISISDYFLRHLHAFRHFKLKSLLPCY